MAALRKENRYAEILERHANGEAIRKLAKQYAKSESSIRTRKKGAQNAYKAQEQAQLLSPVQEKLLANYILEEEAAGRAPSRREVETGQCVHTLEGHGGWVYRVVFSYDSKIVALASEDETVRIWKVETGQCVQTLEGHSSYVHSVVFSHDSKAVASVSEDKTVRIWSVDTGTCGHVNYLGRLPRVLSFTADDTGLVTDAGVIPLVHRSVKSQKSPISTDSHPLLGLDSNDNISWILYRGKDLFRLPAECRYGKIAFSGNSIVIGCNSGRVFVLSFSSHELMGWR